jgi:hypothetical protein
MMARQVAGRFANLRQANGYIYWREAGAQRCRKSPVNARAAGRNMLDLPTKTGKPFRIGFV